MNIIRRKILFKFSIFPFLYQQELHYGFGIKNLILVRYYFVSVTYEGF